MSPNLWAHARREKWNDDERTLAAYLLTCPHRTTEGFFWMPKPYMWADLGWDPARLDHAFATLRTQDFIDYDDAAEVLLIVKAMKYQRPDNENQQKAAVKALHALPENRLWPRFLSAAQEYAQPFTEALRKGLPQAFTEGFGLRQDKPSPSPAPSPTPLNPPTPQGGADGDDAGASEPDSRKPDPVEAVMAHFNAKWVPDPWQKDLRVTPKRRTHIANRLEHFTVEELCQAIDNMRLSPHHIGQNDRNWIANPEFLFREDGQVERFLNRPITLRPGSRPSPGSDAGRLDTDDMRRELGLA